ncbi:hypothetical protein J6TS2_03580 [Heyndrickxia sporothermodurans]|nr:hypothetical protein J6TS2_03580 [Heyndrickxia sporothermodurans]
MLTYVMSSHAVKQVHRSFSKLIRHIQSLYSKKFILSYFLKRLMEGMIDEMISIIGNKQDICEALLELKSLQDLLEKSKTKYFGKLLFQLVGVDTIPIFLYTNDGLLNQMGVDIDYKTGKEYTFTSNYFRIESIDEEKFYASLSILCPLDIHGDVTQHHSEVMKLIKTTTCTEVDLSCIRAIQTLDLDLLKRKIIIEPKW